MDNQQAVSLTVSEGGTKALELENSPLLEGLFHTAQRLTGAELLEVIEKLQAAHAELEADSDSDFTGWPWRQGQTGNQLGAAP